MADILNAASGRWPELLQSLGGLSAEQLTNRHQPCPACGGTDRYRWDNDDGPGGGYCNQCGGKDHMGGALSGLDLLMRVRGWELKQALSAVEQHLGLTHRPDPPTAGAQRFWHYSADFIVCRFPGKHIRPLWWSGTTWQWKAPPAPRPLYWAAPLRPDATVLVCEGEPAADAGVRLFPSHAVCTWPSGCKAIDKASWQPLAGRDVLLWPDADAPGKQAMAKLAGKLLAMGCTVTVVDPPAHLPQGWDLANADGFTPEHAAAIVAKHGRRLEAPEQSPAPEPAATVVATADVAPARGNEPYTLLGFDNDLYFYQPHATGQVIKVRRSAHTGTNLVAVAPMRYWETLFPGKNGPNWTAVASSLFEAQAEVGVYAPDRIRGRGAWWDQGRSVLHLGDRLIIDGQAKPVNTVMPGSDAIYQRLAALRGPGDDPLPTELSHLVSGLALRFHWEVQASGLLMAGWVALAPICGALDWRPHAWLTGSSGSGKSELLRNFVQPLLGDMSLRVVGATTEAGIRQQLRADAIPVVFDESESNERNDQARIQAVLGLARVSSSESGAFTLKGSADGDAQRFLVRSMFLLSSIATSLKQGADLGRFAQLGLRSTKDIPQAERAAHWDALLADLHEYITPEFGRRLQARTIRLIPVIRQAVVVFTRVAAAHFNSQRLGDQYGTLLAGAWSLESEEVPTDDQALSLINAYSWQSFSAAVEVPDEQRCIRRILQHQIRVEAASRVLTRSIGELVSLAMNHDSDADITPDVARKHLGRHGVRIEDAAIAVSNTADAIGKILQDTAWQNCWPSILSRLPGATRTDSAVRFAGTGATARAVVIPVTAIDQQE